MTESDLHRAIMLAVTDAGFRAWRNNVALAWVGTMAPGFPRDGAVLLRNARPLHAGLARGSSDLVGIGPAGRFLAIEAKTERGRLALEQRSWLETIRSRGGIAGVCRSVEDTLALIQGSNP